MGKYKNKSKTKDSGQEKEQIQKKEVSFQLKIPSDDSAKIESKSDSVKELKTCLKKPNIKRIDGKVRFKATSKLKSEKNLTFKKLNVKESDSLSKYDSIKKDLLKQIQTADSNQDALAENGNKNLNFVKRAQLPSRLTNSLLKTIINDKTHSKITNLLDENKSSTQFLKKLVDSKKISKKNKSKLKKKVWTAKINLIKNLSDEKKAKIKREKTVITGDLKPMIDSLKLDGLNAKKANPDLKNISSLFSVINESNVKITDDFLAKAAPSRKEIKEKNQEREMSKSIPKQSIRTKKSQEDVSLFSQLIDFKQFKDNPLDTLKKHLNL